MNNTNDEILLHDYFDNLLSQEEQEKFEEYLIDNIELAIDLGKLKNLERNLKNLSSNFTPPETLIENIIKSVVENSEIIDITEDEPVVSILEKEEVEIGKEKEKKKEKRKLRPKTKYKLKKAFSGFLIIIVLIAIGLVYYFYDKENSTTPWEINLLSINNSQSLQDIETTGLQINSTLNTSDKEELEIIIADKGTIALSSKSKIEVVEGTKSLNSILYYSGNLNFIPMPNNEIFSVIFDNISVQSTNSEFSVNENKNKITINVKTNFITIFDGSDKYNVPERHEFNILNKRQISIPINQNSSLNFTELINSYSNAPNESLMDKIITSATSDEVFTLYFLLPHVTPEYRELIIEKLQNYIPIPASTSKENILILDQSALKDWWEEIYFNIN
jgi:FecR protein